MMNLNLEALKDKLTWYDFVDGETLMGIGIIVQDKHGKLWLTGNAFGTRFSAVDWGCGCCNEDVEVDKVAYLSELLEVEMVEW